ncbi:MAG: hypothetical protein ACR2NM_08740, partial [Bythopirellula sp.]
ALWPFAACERRLVTAYSILLFHPMKWQSEENVGLAKAAEWARHFGQLENDMDDMLADLFGVSHELMNKWINPGRYLSGSELANAGLAELLTTAEILNAEGVMEPILNTLTVLKEPDAVKKPQLRQAP